MDIFKSNYLILLYTLIFDENMYIPQSQRCFVGVYLIENTGCIEFKIKITLILAVKHHPWIGRNREGGKIIFNGTKTVLTQ